MGCAQVDGHVNGRGALKWIGVVFVDPLSSCSGEDDVVGCVALDGTSPGSTVEIGSVVAYLPCRAVDAWQRVVVLSTGADPPRRGCEG